MTGDAKALDELYGEALNATAGASLAELLEFVRKTPHLGAYNAALIRIQREGCNFVATAHEWRKQFGREVVAGARPLVILWPFGPVRFVYDVSDTEGDPIPEIIRDPFASAGPVTDEGYARLVRHLELAGIHYAEADHGPGSAGSMSLLPQPRTAMLGNQPVAQWYGLIVNGNLEVNAKLATVMHELGHLFCGHLGTPAPGNDDQKSAITGLADRTDTGIEAREFEAESVSWLVCGRLGVDTPAGRYLSGHLSANGAVPPVSLEVIFKAVRRIEDALGGREPLGPLLRDDAPRLFRSI